MATNLIKIPKSVKVTPVKKKNDGLTPQTPKTPAPNKAITIPPSPFMKNLGYGTGVKVFLYERSASSPWAVKKISSRLANSSTLYNDRLSYEAKILKNLKHPNIVEFRAWTKSQDGTMCLAMENGEKSLLDLIEERNEKDLGPFPAKTILRVAADIARALDYIHREKRILHGDIKSGNVLIVGDFEKAKLCDFGVCIPLDKNMKASENAAYIGSECWSAPEALAEIQLSDKTDMFSFGLVLWEMLALTIPHLDHLENFEDDDSDKENEEYLEALGTRPPLPEGNFNNDSEYSAILMLFACCTNSNPDLRPSAKAVSDLLSKSDSDTSQ